MPTRYYLVSRTTGARVRLATEAEVSRAEAEEDGTVAVGLERYDVAMVAEPFAGDDPPPLHRQWIVEDEKLRGLDSMRETLERIEARLDAFEQEIDALSEKATGIELGLARIDDVLVGNGGAR